MQMRAGNAITVFNKFRLCFQFTGNMCGLDGCKVMWCKASKHRRVDKGKAGLRYFIPNEVIFLMKRLIRIWQF